MSDLTPGTTIGVYEIERSLGGGGFAAVYLAKHRFLHSKHALKVLAPHLAAEVEVRDRFLAEARILAQLQHPNLVRVTDILIEPGVAALVMEFVAGPTLEAELAGAPRGKPVAWAKAMMAPLLDAVQFAHAHGIVHRDLKPANILLANGHDGALRPVVIDFGIAHLNADTRVTGGRSTPTQVGSRIGTPAYMSPEQIRGQPVSPRSDVFALGAVLYEVLTGATAFDGADAFEVQRAIIDGAFVALRQRRADLPIRLESVVHKALRTDPAARFGSCAEMHKELDEAWVSDIEPASTIWGNSATRAPASRAAPPPPAEEHPAVSEPLAPPVFEPPAPEPPAQAPGGGCLVALATFVGAIAGSCWMPCIGTVLGGLLAWWIASKLTTQAASG